MINTIQEILSYSFMTKALIVGLLVSICSALLGVTLVLKRYALIGDGLSNVGFGSLTVAVALGITPLYVSIPLSILSAVILMRIGSNSKINSDSAIAMIGSGAVAVGVAITSMTTGMNTDVCNMMFGSLVTLTTEDLILSIVTSSVVIFMFIALYDKIFMVTFDEKFAIASGINVNRYNTIIAIMTGVTIVVGMRMMGTILISSILIFPAISSMRLFKTFKHVVISSGIVSVISFLIGIYVAYVYGVSTGASIVLANIALLMIFSISGLVRKIVFAE